MAGPPAFDAVILAGGLGTRLGRADKPGLAVGPATMAAIVAGAVVAAGAGQVILVGPERAEVTAVASTLVVVREDPPGGGPVPALRAGLARARAPWTAVLAADLPFLHGPAVAALVAAAAAAGESGAVIADDSGAPQWLAGCWATARLRGALTAYAGDSLRGLLRPLHPALVPAAAPVAAPVAGPGAGPGAGPSPWLDCDTPADLAAARAWRGRPV